MSINVSRGLNRENIPAIRAKINEALTQLGIEGVYFTLGDITFGPNEFHCRLECSLGTKSDKEREQSELAQRYAKLLLNVDVSCPANVPRHGMSTVTCYNPRARRHPWLVCHADGRTFKYTDEHIKMYWPTIAS